MTLMGLRGIAAAGAILFGAALAVAVARPDLVEKQAHAFVVGEVMDGVSTVLAPVDSMMDSPLLDRLPGRLSARAESLRAGLDAGLSAQVAGVLASICNYCPEKDSTRIDSMEAAVTSVVESRIDQLQQASAIATSWAHGRYTESVTSLMRDLRIFTGVNATLFLLVLVASFVASSAPRHASTLALWLLLAATVLSILGYLFVQDWFWALLTGRFVGYGYAVWVGVVFLVLVDWTMNRARGSEAVLHGIGSVISSIC